MSASRLIFASLYAGVSFLFGLGLGERGELGLVQYVFIIVIPLATVVLTVYAKRGRVNVALTGLAMLGGLLLGQYQFDRAWEDCLVRGERVRVALQDHARTNTLFPTRLEDLPIDLPCRAGMRTTILHYMSNGQGYRLWFANDADRWIATERAPFTSSGRTATR